MHWLPESHVASANMRVTERPRQVLAPAPAFVTTAVYWPFERKWAFGESVCGERKRRGARATAGGSTRVDSAGKGRVTGTKRGTRSCSRGSVAWTRGSEWNRRTIGAPSTAFVIATRLMPWWWAKNACTG